LLTKSRNGYILLRVLMIVPMLLKRLVVQPKQGLASTEARALFSAMLEGGVAEIELGALLASLASRSVTSEELSGFYAAARNHVHRLTLPSPARRNLRALVIPSYSGTREHPNLMPLIALLAARFGLPVVVHGTLEGHGRISSATIFRELGVFPCASPREAQLALTEGRIAFLPVGVLSPRLMQMLLLRNRLGFENCANAVACLLDPFDGHGLKLLPAASPQHFSCLSEVLLEHGDNALLFHGAEGEAYADPKQRPAIEYFRDSEQQTLFEAEPMHAGHRPMCNTRLPEHPDAKSTARWIHDALAGKVPLPPPITNLLACCLFAAGYTDDFNQSKAIVAVRTHSLAPG